MVIVKLHGGLGNQLFQYAYGRALSLRDGVSLGVDLGSFAYDQLRTPMLDRFNAVYQLPSHEQMAKVAGWPTNRLQRMGERLLGRKLRKRHHYEKVRGFQKRLMNLRSPVYVEGYFQTERYFQQVRTQLLQELTLRVPASTRTVELLETVKAVNSVSVHIRRGDYVNDPNVKQIFDVLTPLYYEGALSMVRQQVTDPVFVVFSDEIEWARTQMKWPKETVFVDHTSGDTAHEDLEIMKSCRHNIIANSSFSWWGAWLGEIENRLVIAPDKITHLDAHGEKDMMPERWVGLPV